MTHEAKTRRRIAWQSAVVMGLISGTYSTILITLGAPRIGRSRAIDWMDIGTVLLGLHGIRAEPGLREVAAGVLVHQSADLAWAIAFFALGRRWTLGLSPRTILIAALPWAIATSAIEYYLFLPRLQPLVPLQVPYWTALMVHVTSAAAYPLFPWIRSRITATADWQALSWAKATTVALAMLAAPLLVGEGMAMVNREPQWPFASTDAREFDRSFMQHMVAHHEAGVRLARLALDEELGPEARVLAELIVAEQTREIELLRSWWRSWFDGEMPSVPTHEVTGIPGMPSAADWERLQTSSDQDARRTFLMLMREHHQGAVMMTEDAQQRAGDPRLRTFAYSVRHAQSGQIRWMDPLMTVQWPRLPRRPSTSL